MLDSGETTASTPSENDTVHNEVKSKEPISSDARNDAKQAALAALKARGINPPSSKDDSDTPKSKSVIHDDSGIPVMSLDGTQVMTDDGEVINRPMDSGATVEVEAVPKREYQWDPEHMGVEEQQNPLLAKTLEKLSEDHDIYVEVIEE